MIRLLCALIVFSSSLAFADSTRNLKAKEELTCGVVLGVDRAEQRVQIQTISKIGELEKSVINMRVLPESLNIAKLIQGKRHMKFCVQMPIAQGGKYKAWAVAQKLRPERLGSL